MNKAQLIGHVGKDPEIRTMQGGGKIATFSLATTEAWKDKKTGERKEKTEWHRVVIYGPGLVSVVEKYVKKGAKLFVEGQLSTRLWEDKTGHKNYSTEIVIKSFGGGIELLDRKPATASEPSTHEETPIDESYAGDLIEDDIPF